MIFVVVFLVIYTIYRQSKTTILYVIRLQIDFAVVFLFHVFLIIHHLFAGKYSKLINKGPEVLYHPRHELG